MKIIKDITGNSIKVTDLDAAIKQCKDCIESLIKWNQGILLAKIMRIC